MRTKARGVGTDVALHSVEVEVHGAMLTSPVAPAQLGEFPRERVVTLSPQWVSGALGPS